MNVIPTHVAMILALGCLLIGIVIGILVGTQWGKRKLERGADTLELNIDGMSYSLHPRTRRRTDKEAKKLTHSEWRARHSKRRKGDV